ncbi:UNVERIFIED_ORG: hypothetical protein LHK14_23520 (plasmid) [Roseateles sp. XES5]|nr:hypothetical protein [Roseateles sp. XES5]
MARSTAGHGAHRPLEFVREKWEPIFPKRQTKTKEFRAFPVKSGSPEMLWLFVFTALSDAEAIPLRLEML